MRSFDLVVMHEALHAQVSNMNPLPPKKNVRLYMYMYMYMYMYVHRVLVFGPYLAPISAKQRERESHCDFLRQSLQIQ